jgi:hypothetical protein
MKTVLILNTDQLGHGDPALGQKLLGMLFRKTPAFHDLDAVLLYNAGVKVLAPDSPHLAELTLMEENGVDLFACVTCLSHYGIEAAVGTVSDMDTILREMDRAEKVITL